MDPTEQKPYFDKSARRMLAKALGATSNFKTERTEAAKILLRQFERLVKEYELTPQVDRYGMSVMFGSFGKKGVFINQEGWPRLRHEDNEYEVSLIFDPTTKQFEGTDEDLEVVPTPGELRPHQSALAVLVSGFISKVMRGGL